MIHIVGKALETIEKLGKFRCFTSKRKWEDRNENLENYFINNQIVFVDINAYSIFF